MLLRTQHFNLIRVMLKQTYKQKQCFTRVRILEKKPLQVPEVSLKTACNPQYLDAVYCSNDKHFVHLRLKFACLDPIPLCNYTMKNWRCWKRQNIHSLNLMHTAGKRRGSLLYLMHSQKMTLLSPTVSSSWNSSDMSLDDVSENSTSV